MRRLAEAMAAKGVRSEIICTSAKDMAPLAEVPVRAYPHELAKIPVAAKLYRSRAMATAIRHAAADGSLLHSHGLWTLPNVYAASAARYHAAPHIISPRGMLGAAALQFSRAAKRIVWSLTQRRALLEAACIHATSPAERDDIRAVGINRPVAIIPNGIDVPAWAAVSMDKQRRNPSQRTLLHLGRLHPKKGIDRLLQAWASVELRSPDWSLQIVGPSEAGHGEALTAQSAALGLRRVEFRGPLFGAEKEASYRNADLFVLPTLDENFGMVVAEALANGTPVICTKGAPWAALNTERCGWWVEHGVAPMEAMLEAAMNMPRLELDQMGARGHRWMEKEFSWERVADDMETVYRWCLSGEACGNIPSVVDMAR